MPHENTHLQRILTLALYLGGIYLFFRTLLIPLLPFLLALGLSTLLEPAIQKMRKRMKVQRAFAAVVLISAVLFIFGGSAVLLTLRLGEELMAWSRRLPDAVAAFPVLWNRALDRVEGWYAASPRAIRSALDLLAETVSENATSFMASAGGFLVEKVSSLASLLPGAGLFLVTTILALYFTSVNYSTILAFLKRQLPSAWQAKCRAAARCCRATLLKWLRSELLLLTATFLILLLGFWWMGTEYALLTAFSIALVDAFPVLGAGTALLPWAAFTLLLGDVRTGVTLLVLYAAVLLSHAFLEPRLLAGQSGLPPIAMLLAIYLGFQFLGVGGMLLLPVLLLLAKQLRDAEIIRLWK